MSTHGRIFSLFPTVALLLLFLASTASAACPSVSGELRGLEHNIAGSISISEDCSLSAKGFSYDGQAPKVFWWGAPDCSAGTIKKEGRRISNQQLAKSYNNDQVCEHTLFRLKMLHS